MRWHRQNSFHNSQNDEASTGVVVSQARLTVAWMINSALRKLRKLAKPRVERPADMIVVHFGDRQGFTVLGSAIAHHAVHESAMTCPFPEQEVISAQRRAMARSAARTFAHHAEQAANDSVAHSSER